MSLSQEKYASFFIRFWQEPREKRGETPEWRGSIEHVQSRKKRYFRDIKTLIAFIQEVMGSADSSSGRRKYIA
ncbi:MAG: hypothetical protein ACE5MB_00680 [Anaerolineae bacterium]